jgi:hypothetical protein
MEFAWDSTALHQLQLNDDLSVTSSISNAKPALDKLEGIRRRKV